MIFCHKCGTQQTEDSAFCRKCGARLIVDESLPQRETQQHIHLPKAETSVQKLNIAAVSAPLPEDILKSECLPENEYTKLYCKLKSYFANSESIKSIALVNGKVIVMKSNMITYRVRYHDNDKPIEIKTELKIWITCIFALLWIGLTTALAIAIGVEIQIYPLICFGIGVVILIIEAVIINKYGKETVSSIHTALGNKSEKSSILSDKILRAFLFPLVVSLTIITPLPFVILPLAFGILIIEAT